MLPLKNDDDLNSLVRLAARICNSPISMINLVADDRQWTQASVGIDIIELPREEAFCNHTIQEQNGMIVRDALEDDRFRESPLVLQDPNIRFYAGYNIKGTGGHNIGSLCVIDRKPRELTEHQLESLQILAREVEARLNLKKKNQELEKTATFLNNSADLMFIVDPNLYQIKDLNSEMNRLLGYDAGELVGKPLSILGPGTDFFNELNHWAGQDDGSGGRFIHQTQVRSKDGASLWFEIVICEKDGLWYATGRNIQEMKEVEETHRETLKVLRTAQRIADIGHWEWYPQEDRLIWSKKMYEMLEIDIDGYSPSVAGFMELVPDDERQVVESVVAKVLGGGEMPLFEHRCITKGGDTIDVVQRGEVQRDELGAVVKVSGIMHNVTRQKETERTIRESLQEKEMLLAEVHHRVKNNLAMMSGIIQLEMTTVTSDAEQSSIQSVLSRIKSLALVHENLYQSDSFSQVPFGELLTDLVSIPGSFSKAGNSPMLDIDINASTVELNINQAIPLALAINDLMYQCIQINCRLATIRLSESQNIVSLDIRACGNPWAALSEQKDGHADGGRGSGRGIGLLLFESLLTQFGGSFRIDEAAEDSVLYLTFEKTDEKGSSDGQFVSGL